MKMKKLLSSIISVSLISGMFASYSVSAETTVAGKTEEIVSFNFEDGNKTPAYTYGGTTFKSTVQNNVWTSGATDDVWGKKFDRSLCLYDAGSDPWFFVTTQKTNSPLLDIGGGSVVVSWDMALKDDACQPQINFYYTRKDTSGALSGKTLTFSYTTTNAKLQTASSDGKTYDIASLKRPGQEWHHYDIVMEYGRKIITVYIDGKRSIAVEDDKNFGGAQYTFAGLGQPNYENMVGFRLQQGTSSGSTGYFDNIKIRKYDSSETFFTGTGSKFVPKYTQDFSNAEDNKSNGTLEYLNRLDADFKVVTGAFGKASTDKSFKIVRNADTTAGHKDIFYQRADYGVDFQYGGKVHIGFNMAMEGDERNFAKYISVKPENNGTRETLLRMEYGLLKYGNSLSVPVNWESKKWYKFDLYITPGDGETVKNKMTVYMNGQKMFENVELTDYSFPGVDQVRIGQMENFIHDTSKYEYNQVLYLDDISLEYTAKDIPVKYPSFSMSSLDESVVKLVDKNTLFVYNNPTISGVMAKVSASNVYAVSDEMTQASNADSAVGKYLLAKATDEIRYLFPIVDRIDRYSEDFSEEIYINDERIKNWNFVTYNGVASQETGLGGKKATDRSYKVSGGTVEQEYSYIDTPIAVSGKTMIEFSMLMNDDKANDGFAVAFKYKDSEGNEQNSSIVNLAWLWNNQIRVLTGNNSENIVGYYGNNQWNKFAFEINPETFTANVYINGTLISEDAKILPEASYSQLEGCKITGIYRIKHSHQTASTSQDKYSAIDDIKIYQGTYNNAADAMTLTTDYYVNSGWIAIPEATDKSDFDSNIDSNYKDSIKIYTDNTMSSEIVDEFDTIEHDQYLVCETAGGAIHYYRIVAQDEPVKINMVIKNEEGTELGTDDLVDLGKYKMYVEYEKYNNDSENAYIILGEYIYSFDNENLQLDEVDIESIDLSFGAHTTKEVEVSVEEYDRVLKAMAWNSENNIPFGTAATYGLFE